MQQYKQTTCETCLSICVLNLAGEKISRKKELEIIDYVIRKDREDFIGAHCEYAAKKLGKKAKLIIENTHYANYVQKRIGGKKITIQNQKISLKLIDQLINTSKVIINIDDFALWKIYHYPHFLIILKRIGKNYEIFDPWDGKTKLISQNTIKKGIIMLRNHQKLSPVVIRFEQNTHSLKANN